MFPRTNLEMFQTLEGHKPLDLSKNTANLLCYDLPVYTFIYDSTDKVGICGKIGCSAEVCSLRVLLSSLLNHICWVLLFSYTDSVDPSKTGYWSEKFVTVFCRIAGGMLSTCVLNVWYNTHLSYLSPEKQPLLASTHPFRFPKLTETGKSGGKKRERQNIIAISFRLCFHPI